jgi:hypothetical protein
MVGMPAHGPFGSLIHSQTTHRWVVSHARRHLPPQRAYAIRPYD